MSSIVFMFANEVRSFSRAFFISYKNIESLEKLSNAVNLSREKIEEERRYLLYQVSVMGHITLYEFWEYQVRRLIRMLEHRANITYNNISDLEKAFTRHRINIILKNYFPLLYELRLICNALKHGEGYSEKDLRVFNKDIFNKIDKNVLFTPMVVEHLKLNSISYYKYPSEIEKFWQSVQHNLDNL